MLEWYSSRALGLGYLRVQPKARTQEFCYGACIISLQAGLMSHSLEYDYNDDDEDDIA